MRNAEKGDETGRSKRGQELQQAEIGVEVGGDSKCREETGVEAGGDRS